MPKPITFNGRAASGVASDAMLRNFARALSSFDGDVSVTIAAAKRSNSANSYYWAGVLPSVTEFLNAAGYELEIQDTHEKVCKPWFLPARVIEVPCKDDLGSVREEVVYGSTRTDSHTFWSFINAIRDYPPFVAAGLYVPEPGERLTGRTIHEPGGTKVTFAAQGSPSDPPMGRDDPPEASTPEATPLSDEPFAEKAGAHADDPAGPLHPSQQSYILNL